VQQAGDSIRATVQLTDVDTRQTIWAERYDRIVDEVFKLQDEITREVISALNIMLIKAESYRDCGEVDLSISAAKESIRVDPKKDDAQLILCSDYELAADHDQARSAADKIIASNPAFSLVDYARRQPYKHPAPLDRIVSALRDAGLPE
jgi:tetratricopeptide (TPR) repeat protein